MACDIAARRGFNGIRWMKMTDPSSKKRHHRMSALFYYLATTPCHLYVENLSIVHVLLKNFFVSMLTW